MLILFFIVLVFLIMGVQLYLDSLLLNKFTYKELCEYIDNNRNYELQLLNLKFRSFILPSYRGRYQSIILPDKFSLNINDDFILLSINSHSELQRKYIKIYKTNCKIQKDIFAGNLLVIKIDEFRLTFKIPQDFKL